MKRTRLLLACSTTLAAVATGIGCSSTPALAGTIGIGISDCAGMAIPADPGHPSDSPPVVGPETVPAVGGGFAQALVLDHATDPDGDPLATTAVSTPPRGKVCISSNGVITYLSLITRGGYTEYLTYTVSDGQESSTSTITIPVEGVLPMRAQLLHRLVYWKGTHRVKHRAVYGFTNPNRHPMFVISQLRTRSLHYFQGLGAGRSEHARTRQRRVAYLARLVTNYGVRVVVERGVLDTRTGRQTFTFYAVRPPS